MLAAETRSISSKDVWIDASALRAVRVSRHALVLGTDGEPAANGAVRVARLLADGKGLDLHVVGVVDGLPPASVGAYRLANEADSALVVGLRARIEEQLMVLGIPAEASDVEIVVGHPQAALGDIAKREHARLIIVGRSARSLLGRMLGLSTALGVARYASAAVLAVDPATKTLPRIAVVGTDFGRASIATARTALACMGPRGVLHFVHARPVMPPIGPRAFAVDVAYATELADRVESVGAALHAPSSVRVVTHVLAGSPARRLLEVAEQESADLIAVGMSSGRPRGAFVIGSTAARILAESHGSVLVMGAYRPAPRGDAIDPQADELTSS